MIASYIKPWSRSDNRERLDPYNGFLLLPNLDKAFDLGYISFTASGKIKVSEFIEKPGVLGISDSMQIALESKHQEYLEYHRAHVFEKSLRA